MSEIVDTGWITRIDNEVTRKSFLVRAQPAIEKIVRDVLSNVTSKITTEFGEYLISNSARDTLKDEG